MPLINVSPVELWALRKILESADYEVYSPEEVMTLADHIHDIETGQMQIQTAQQQLMDKFNALNLSTLTSHIDTVLNVVNGLQAGQTLEQSDIDALQTAAGNIQQGVNDIKAEFQPTPTPTP